MRALPRPQKHNAKLIGYCHEGLIWAEMQNRPTDQGSHAALSSIHSYCTRHGYTCLHLDSRDYDTNTARLREAGN